MRTVALPDPVYAEAERAAAARGQSVEDYVVEVVRQCAEDEAPLVLTPEQIEKVRAAQESVRAGRTLTLEEFDARFAERREAWLKAHPDAR